MFIDKTKFNSITILNVYCKFQDLINKFFQNSLPQIMFQILSITDTDKLQYFCNQLKKHDYVIDSQTEKLVLNRFKVSPLKRKKKQLESQDIIDNQV